MENIIEKLSGYGIGGLILAYFVYNDFQDRVAYRNYLKKISDKLSQMNENIAKHDIRITKVEATLERHEEKIDTLYENRR